MTTDEGKTLAEVFKDDADLLLADGFDDALIGIGQRCGQPDVAIYSIPLALGILVSRDGMEPDEAREYLEFNTLGAWVGPKTPIWVDPLTVSELRDQGLTPSPAR